MSKTDAEIAQIIEQLNDNAGGTNYFATYEWTHLPEAKSIDEVFDAMKNDDYLIHEVISNLNNQPAKPWHLDITQIIPVSSQEFWTTAEEHLEFFTGTDPTILHENFAELKESLEKDIQPGTKFYSYNINRLGGAYHKPVDQKSDSDNGRVFKSYIHWSFELIAVNEQTGSFILTGYGSEV